MCASITSTSATSPNACAACAGIPWASIGDARQTVTRAMFKRVRYEG
jgi:hypothetical protein